MGKPSQSLIVCNFCGINCYKINSQINIAAKNNKPLFCSYRCSNKARATSLKEILICEYCKKSYSRTRIGQKRRFCSIKCAGLLAADQRYKIYIQKWLSGLESSNRVSSHIRRYLFELNDNKCSVCKWSKVNNFTGKIPLEVDHINGNWKDNNIDNLRLLCPCCHALTSNYKILNKGKGRQHHYKQNQGEQS